jgi:hypothetical protein
VFESDPLQAQHVVAVCGLLRRVFGMFGQLALPRRDGLVEGPAVFSLGGWKKPRPCSSPGCWSIPTPTPVARQQPFEFERVMKFAFMPAAIFSPGWPVWPAYRPAGRRREGKLPRGSGPTIAAHGDRRQRTRRPKKSSGIGEQIIKAAPRFSVAQRVAFSA